MNSGNLGRAGAHPAHHLDPPLVPDETGMDQVLSDLQALKGLYGLLHKGQANENYLQLDEVSRALLMRMLDDATQQALLRQAKMLSGPLMSPALERKLSIQPRHRPRGDAEPRLRTIVSPSLSIYDSEISRRLKRQSSARRRDGGHRVHDHFLARVASNRSSVPRPHPNPEESLARLGSYRSSTMATRQQSGGTVGAGSAPRVDRGDGCGMPRRSSGRGDKSSLERSSRRRSVSREPSSRGRERLHGRAAGRLAGAHGSPTRRFGRMESGLSLGPRMTSRGSERAGSGGAATPRRSSSSNDGAVTIRSRIRPNRELIERCLRRAEEESLPRRRGKDGSSSSVSMGWSSRRPRRTLNRIDSGSTYSRSSTGAARSCACTSPTAPSTSGASASSSSLSVSRRGNVLSEYAFEASSTSRSRRRRERQERREGRLRRLKNKLALVFHHRHDHHHHHHIARGRPGSKDGLSGRDCRANHGRSPWKYVGRMFHRTTGHGVDKKTTTRTVVTVPAKRSGGGGGGHVHSLFDALVRHKWGARKAPAGAAMRRTSSRVQVKKMHWWQRLRRRRGRREVARSCRPRRRLGQGKAV